MDIVKRLLSEKPAGALDIPEIQMEAASEITRLRDALFAADWALMEMNGCFPLPHGSRPKADLHTACVLVRAETSEDNTTRVQRANRVIQIKQRGCGLLD